jgi:hypothetical protein
MTKPWTVHSRGNKNQSFFFQELAY